MTILQIAKELGKTTAQTSTLVKQGKIKGKKNRSGRWEIKEEDFDQYLLSRSLRPPEWYFKCKLERPYISLQPNIIAKPYEVTLKNYLPTLTPEQYQLACTTSEERNK